MCLCETLPPYDPTSLTEDFINCSCSRGRGSLVETLPVGKGFDCMDDLEYFQKKVWTSLRVPPSYMLEPPNTVLSGGPNECSPPSFRVVCDETNNTPETIDQNQLVIDIYVRVNYITINLVIVDPAVEDYDRAMKVVCAG